MKNKRKPHIYYVDKEILRKLSGAGLFDAWVGITSGKKPGERLYRVKGTAKVLEFFAEHAPEVLEQKKAELAEKEKRKAAKVKEEQAREDT